MRNIIFYGSAACFFILFMIPAAVPVALGHTSPIARDVILRGKAVDATGMPVQGARITLIGHASSRRKAVLTNAEGEFTVPIRAGAKKFFVFVIHEKRRLGARADIVVKGKQEKLDLKIKMAPTGSISGRLLNIDQEPVAGVQVALWFDVPKADGLIRYNLFVATKSDGRGKFTHRNLVPGVTYSVRVQPKRYVPTVAGAAQAASNQDKTLPDCVLTPADHSISGAVVDLAGKPVSGAVVQAQAEDRTLLGDWHVKSDKYGRFRIDKLPKGNTRVSAHVLLAAPRLPSGAQTFAFGPSTSLQVPAGSKDVRIVVKTSKTLPSESILVGKPAPTIVISKWANRRLPNGSEFPNKQYMGRVVVLAFIDNAKPSRRIIDQLIQLQKKHERKKIQIICLAEDLPNAKNLKNSPIVFALVNGGLVPGGNGEAFQKYRVAATPTLFLIDRKGIIRAADVEPADLDDLIAKTLKSTAGSNPGN